MTTMDLLTIPGMDGSERLRRMRKESQKRMREAALSGALAAAVMSAKTGSNGSRKKS